MKKIIIFISIFGLVISFSSPGQANGILEFFYPMLKKPPPNTSETLEAPFADKEAIKAQDLGKGLPENAIPLHLSHRNEKQIGDWLMTSVAESLTFDRQTADESLNNVRKYFDAGGWAEYEAYLEESNTRNVLSSGRYSIRSFVEDQPLPLNTGEVNGSFKWLMEVPVMVSYLDKNLKDYGESKQEPVTQNIVVTVQVGRYPDAANEHSVLIERWDVRVIKSSKNQL